MPASPFAALCFVAAALASAHPAEAGQYAYAPLTLADNTGSQASNDINSHGQWLGTNIPTGSGSFQTFLHQGSHVRLIGVNEQLYLSSNLTSKGLAAGTLQASNKGVTFSLATGKTTILPHPANVIVEPIRVSESGAVVGAVLTNAGASRAYLLAGGHVSVFNFPAASNTSANAINASGVVAGVYQVGQGPQRGFTWKAGKFTKFDVPGAVFLTVTGIDAAGRVIGSYQDAANVTHGFTATGGTGHAFDYPGARGTYLSGFGPAGQLIGNTFDANQTSTSHGFIQTGGAFTLINYPGASASGTTISAMNSQGTLVGGFTDASGVAKAFIAVCPAGQAPCTK